MDRNMQLFRFLYAPGLRRTSIARHVETGFHGQDATLRSSNGKACTTDGLPTEARGRA